MQIWDFRKVFVVKDFGKLYVQFSNKFQCTDNWVDLGVFLLIKKPTKNPNKTTRRKFKLILCASTYLHFSCRVSVAVLRLFVFQLPLKSRRAPWGDFFRSAQRM